MAEDAAANQPAQADRQQSDAGNCLPEHLHRVWDDSSRAHNLSGRGFAAPSTSTTHDESTAPLAVMPLSLFAPRNPPSESRLRNLIAAYINNQGEDSLPLLTAYGTREGAEEQARRRAGAGRTGVRISKIATAALQGWCCRAVRSVMDELEMGDSYERKVGQDEYLVSETIPGKAVCEEVKWDEIAVAQAPEPDDYRL